MTLSLGSLAPSVLGWTTISFWLGLSPGLGFLADVSLLQAQASPSLSWRVLGRSFDLLEALVNRLVGRGISPFPIFTFRALHFHFGGVSHHQSRLAVVCVSLRPQAVDSLPPQSDGAGCLANPLLPFSHGPTFCLPRYTYLPCAVSRASCRLASTIWLSKESLCVPSGLRLALAVSRFPLLLVRPVTCCWREAPSTGLRVTEIPAAGVPSLRMRAHCTVPARSSTSRSSFVSPATKVTVCDTSW